ncbi:MAG: hypothetical protein PUF37_07745 [Prevotellaceae bacterium]|nr:hypothetical protein [Prevotellaceae bacterium]
MDKRIFIIMLLSFVCIMPASALVGTDGIRAGAYELMKVREKKVVETNTAAFALNLAGHKLSQKEMETIKKCTDAYNEALDSISDAISVAANCYGLFYEVDQALSNVARLRNTVSKCPDNIIAVALSPSRQKMYDLILQDGLDLVSDLPSVLPIKIKINGMEFGGSKIKMGERLLNISRIRERIHKLNHDVSRLTYILTYTTMLDTYYELGGQKMYKTKDIKTIVTLCQQRMYQAEFKAWHKTSGTKNVWVRQLENTANSIFSN